MKPPKRPRAPKPPWRAPVARPKRGGSRRQTNASREVCRQQPICWLRLPGCTVRSNSLDHYHPVKTHPHLEWVPSNWRGACLHCNTARGATPVYALPELRAKMERKRKPPTALGFFS